MAKKKTYADEAKTIMNKYKPRLGEKFDKGDTLALEAMNQELTALREKQERARVQGLVDGASPEQISQLSQAFQAQNNQGSDQPGIPQGGPSGLAGGQSGAEPQIAGQSQFAGGGELPQWLYEARGRAMHQFGGDITKIPRRRQQTFSTLMGNQNIPFVGNMLQGQPTNLQAGVNPIGQPSVRPQLFPGSEQPIVNQNLMQRDTTGGNQIPFASQKQANRFSRQAPGLAEEFSTQRRNQQIQQQQQQLLLQGFATGGNLLPMFQGGGYSINPANFYGQPEYPESERQLNYFQDYFQDLGQGVYPKPYDRFAAGRGTSPWSPFGAVGAGGQSGTPNIAGVAGDPTFPRVHGNEPLGQGGLGDFQGLTAAQKLGVTYNPNTGAGGVGVGGAGGGGAGAGAGLPAIATPNPWEDPNINLDTFDPLTFDSGQDVGQPPTSFGGDQTQVGDPYKFRVPWWGAAATGLGSILGNRQLDLSEHEFSPQEVSPNLVDYSREREQFQRDRDIANRMIQRQGASLGSRAGLMQNLQVGATGTQREEGRLFSRSLQGEANQNAQIRNQAAMFNAQQRSMADRLNTQYDRESQLINAQRRQNQIAGVTGAVTGYGRDLMAANYATGGLRLNEDPEFPIMQQNDAWWKRGLGVDADPYKRYTGPRRRIGQIQT